MVWYQNISSDTNEATNGSKACAVVTAVTLTFVPPIKAFFLNSYGDIMSHNVLLVQVDCISLSFLIICIIQVRGMHKYYVSTSICIWTDCCPADGLTISPMYVTANA